MPFVSRLTCRAGPLRIFVRCPSYSRVPVACCRYFMQPRQGKLPGFSGRQYIESPFTHSNKGKLQTSGKAAGIVGIFACILMHDQPDRACLADVDDLIIPARLVAKACSRIHVKLNNGGRDIYWRQNADTFSADSLNKWFNITYRDREANLRIMGNTFTDVLQHNQYEMT